MGKGCLRFLVIMLAFLSICYLIKEAFITPVEEMGSNSTSKWNKTEDIIKLLDKMKTMFSLWRSLNKTELYRGIFVNSTNESRLSEPGHEKKHKTQPIGKINFLFTEDPIRYISITSQGSADEIFPSINTLGHIESIKMEELHTVDMQKQSTINFKETTNTKSTSDFKNLETQTADSKRLEQHLVNLKNISLPLNYRMAKEEYGVKQKISDNEITSSYGITPKTSTAAAPEKNNLLLPASEKKSQFDPLIYEIKPTQSLNPSTDVSKEAISSSSNNQDKEDSIISSLLPIHSDPKPKINSNTQSGKKQNLLLFKFRALNNEDYDIIDTTVPTINYKITNGENNYNITLDSFTYYQKNEDSIMRNLKNTGSTLISEITREPFSERTKEIDHEIPVFSGITSKTPNNENPEKDNSSSPALEKYSNFNYLNYDKNDIQTLKPSTKHATNSITEPPKHYKSTNKENNNLVVSGYSDFSIKINKNDEHEPLNYTFENIFLIEHSDFDNSRTEKSEPSSKDVIITSTESSLHYEGPKAMNKEGATSGEQYVSIMESDFWVKISNDQYQYQFSSIQIYNPPKAGVTEITNDNNDNLISGYSDFSIKTTNDDKQEPLNHTFYSFTPSDRSDLVSYGTENSETNSKSTIISTEPSLHYEDLNAKNNGVTYSKLNISDITIKDFSVIAEISDSRNYDEINTIQIYNLSLEDVTVLTESSIDYKNSNSTNNDDITSVHSEVRIKMTNNDKYKLLNYTFERFTPSDQSDFFNGKTENSKPSSNEGSNAENEKGPTLSELNVSDISIKDFRAIAEISDNRNYDDIKALQSFNLSSDDETESLVDYEYFNSTNNDDILSSHSEVGIKLLNHTFESITTSDHSYLENREIGNSEPNSEDVIISYKSHLHNESPNGENTKEATPRELKVSSINMKVHNVSAKIPAPQNYEINGLIIHLFNTSSENELDVTESTTFYESTKEENNDVISDYFDFSIKTSINDDDKPLNYSFDRTPFNHSTVYNSETGKSESTSEDEIKSLHYEGPKAENEKGDTVSELYVSDISIKESKIRANIFDSKNSYNTNVIEILNLSRENETDLTESTTDFVSSNEKDNREIPSDYYENKPLNHISDSIALSEHSDFYYNDTVQSERSSEDVIMSTKPSLQYEDRNAENDVDTKISDHNFYDLYDSSTEDVIDITEPTINYTNTIEDYHDILSSSSHNQETVYSVISKLLPITSDPQTKIYKNEIYSDTQSKTLPSYKFRHLNKEDFAINDTFPLNPTTETIINISEATRGFKNTNVSNNKTLLGSFSYNQKTENSIVSKFSPEPSKPISEIYMNEIYKNTQTNTGITESTIDYNNFKRKNSGDVKSGYFDIRIQTTNNDEQKPLNHTISSVAPFKQSHFYYNETSKSETDIKHVIISTESSQHYERQNTESEEGPSPNEMMVSGISINESNVTMKNSNNQNFYEGTNTSKSTTEVVRYITESHIEYKSDSEVMITKNYNDKHEPLNHTFEDIAPFDHSDIDNSGTEKSEPGSKNVIISSKSSLHMEGPKVENEPKPTPYEVNVSDTNIKESRVIANISNSQAYYEYNFIQRFNLSTEDVIDITESLLDYEITNESNNNDQISGYADFSIKTTKDDKQKPLNRTFDSFTSSNRSDLVSYGTENSETNSKSTIISTKPSLHYEDLNAKNNGVTYSKLNISDITIKDFSVIAEISDSRNFDEINAIQKFNMFLEDVTVLTESSVDYQNSNSTNNDDIVSNRSEDRIKTTNNDEYKQLNNTFQSIIPSDHSDLDNYGTENSETSLNYVIISAKSYPHDESPNAENKKEATPSGLKVSSINIKVHKFSAKIPATQNYEINGLVIHSFNMSSENEIDVTESTTYYESTNEENNNVISDYSDFSIKTSIDDDDKPLNYSFDRSTLFNQSYVYNGESGESKPTSEEEIKPFVSSLHYEGPNAENEKVDTVSELYESNISIKESEIRANIFDSKNSYNTNAIQILNLSTEDEIDLTESTRDYVSSNEKDNREIPSDYSDVRIQTTNYDELKPVNHIFDSIAPSEHSDFSYNDTVKSETSSEDVIMFTKSSLHFKTRNPNNDRAKISDHKLYDLYYDSSTEDVIDITEPTINYTNTIEEYHDILSSYSHNPDTEDSNISKLLPITSEPKPKIFIDEMYSDTQLKNRLTLPSFKVNDLDEQDLSINDTFSLNPTTENIINITESTRDFKNTNSDNNETLSGPFSYNQETGNVIISTLSPLPSNSISDIHMTEIYSSTQINRLHLLPFKYRDLSEEFEFPFHTEQLVFNEDFAPEEGEKFVFPEEGHKELQDRNYGNDEEPIFLRMQPVIEEIPILPNLFLNYTKTNTETTNEVFSIDHNRVGSNNTTTEMSKVIDIENSKSSSQRSKEYSAFDISNFHGRLKPTLEPLDNINDLSMDHTKVKPNISEVATVKDQNITSEFYNARPELSDDQYAQSYLATGSDFKFKPTIYGSDLGNRETQPSKLQKSEKSLINLKNVSSSPKYDKKNEEQSKASDHETSGSPGITPKTFTHEDLVKKNSLLPATDKYLHFDGTLYPTTEDIRHMNYKNANAEDILGTVDASSSNYKLSTQTFNSNFGSHYFGFDISETKTSVSKRNYVRIPTKSSQNSRSSHLGKTEETISSNLKVTGSEEITNKENYTPPIHYSRSYSVPSHFGLDTSETRTSGFTKGDVSAFQKLYQNSESSYLGKTEAMISSNLKIIDPSNGSTETSNKENYTPSIQYSRSYSVPSHFGLDTSETRTSGFTKGDVSAFQKLYQNPESSYLGKTEATISSNLKIIDPSNCSKETSNKENYTPSIQYSKSYSVPSHFGLDTSETRTSGFTKGDVSAFQKLYQNSESSYLGKTEAMISSNLKIIDPSNGSKETSNKENYTPSIQYSRSYSVPSHFGLDTSDTRTSGFTKGDVSAFQKLYQNPESSYLGKTEATISSNLKIIDPSNGSKETSNKENYTPSRQYSKRYFATNYTGLDKSVTKSSALTKYANIFTKSSQNSESPFSENRKGTISNNKKATDFSDASEEMFNKGNFKPFSDYSKSFTDFDFSETRTPGSTKDDVSFIQKLYQNPESSYLGKTDETIPSNLKVTGSSDGSKAISSNENYPLSRQFSKSYSASNYTSLDNSVTKDDKFFTSPNPEKNQNNIYNNQNVTGPSRVSKEMSDNDNYKPSIDNFNKTSAPGYTNLDNIETIKPGPSWEHVTFPSEINPFYHSTTFEKNDEGINSNQKATSSFDANNQIPFNENYNLRNRKPKPHSPLYNSDFYNSETEKAKSSLEDGKGLGETPLNHGRANGDDSEKILTLVNNLIHGQDYGNSVTSVMVVSDAHMMVSEIHEESKVPLELGISDYNKQTTEIVPLSIAHDSFNMFDEKNINIRLYDLVISYNNTHLRGEVALTIDVSSEMDEINLHFEGLAVSFSSFSKITTAPLQENLIVDIKDLVYDKERKKVITKLKSAIKPKNSYKLSLNFVSELSPFEKGAALTSFIKRSFGHQTESKSRIIGTFLFPNFGKEVFPCIETPERRSVFHLRLKHDVNDEVVSNTFLNKANELNPADVIYDFGKTPPIPIYSFSFYILPKYDSIVVERTPSLVFRFPPYHRYSVIPLVNIASGFLDFFMEYFEYNLPTQQISVVVNDNLYSDPPASFATILISSKYIIDRNERSYENEESLYYFIAKQFCDLWIGNIVSFNSWEDNWIKEGFSIFMAQLAVMDFFEAYDFSSFITRIQEDAFRYHRFPHWHDNDLYKDEFNTNSKMNINTPYKGAFLLRMVYNILKPQPFQEGIRSFFNEWALQSVSPEVFWNSFNVIQENIDVNEFIASWAFAYFPILYIEIEHNTIVVKQVPQTDLNEQLKSRWIPINFMTGKDIHLDYTITHWVKHKESTRIKLHINDTWVICNPQYSGFFRVNYSKELWKMIIIGMRKEISKFPSSVKAQLLDDAFTLASDNHLDYSVPMTMALYLKYEEEYAPWLVVLKHFSYIAQNLIHYPEWQIFQQYVAGIMSDISQSLHIKTDTENDKNIKGQLRKILMEWSCFNGLPNGCFKWTFQKFLNWKDDPSSLSHSVIPTELKSIIYCMGAKLDDHENTKFLYSFSKNETITQAEALRLLRSVTCTYEMTTFMEILEDVFNEENPAFSLLRLKEFLLSLKQSHFNSLIAFRYIHYYWKTLYERFKRSNGILNIIIERTTYFLRTKKQYEEVLTLRQAVPRNDYSTLASIDQAIDQIIYNIKWEANHLERMRKWLRLYNNTLI